MKILIVEDEKRLNNLLIEFLKKEGFTCETVFNYADASQKINDYDYDILIIDIMLPDGSGLDIVKKMKLLNSETGILIISAKDSIDDKIFGLDIGADDYITKPFHFAELNARIKSVIRRRTFKGNKEITFNELTIFPDNKQVFVLKKELDLTKTEYNMLLFLVSNKNKVLTKESIAEHLWGDSIDKADSFDFIYNHMKNLRLKLQHAGANNYIKTVYGMGYKFEDEYIVNL